MILRLAVRSLLTHPIRTLVLACGFGLGVGVMATLLGVGEVILDQARSPAVSGGGDVVVASSTGELPSARWILSSGLRGAGLEERVRAASPSRRAMLFLVKKDGVLPIRAQGGIPSLEHAIGDAETAGVAAWADAEGDAAWSSPDPAAALMALDRFHPIPDVPARAGSWAEWLYFNGRAGEHQFYLTFLVGPAKRSGKRNAGVRLQLDRGGRRSSFSHRAEVDDEDVLSSAPNLTIGGSNVRLEGMRYHITLDLPSGAGRVTGDILIEASPGRALPPLTIRGAGGWLSGYVVPVMSGKLSGALTVDGAAVPLDGGVAYHDHNWGFWEGVSWRWGQVQHGDLSIVYGRVHPPADAADPERIPGFLAAIGPDGPIGYASNLSIDESNHPASGRPQTIVVKGRGASLDITMELRVDGAIVTKSGGGLFGERQDFLQLRATYRVQGRAGDRSLDFTAAGSAETFRGQR
jgi:hypothetical protein